MTTGEYESIIYILENHLFGQAKDEEADLITMNPEDMLEIFKLIKKDLKKLIEWKN